jgi:hypothetical protein
VNRMKSCLARLGIRKSPRDGKARQCCLRRADLPAPSGSCLPPKNVAGSHDRYSSRPVSPVLSPAPISVSSSLLKRATNEPEILPSSTRQICLMSADGGHREGKGEMTKASIDLQDLRRRLFQGEG